MGVEYIDGHIYPSLGDSLVACQWRNAKMRHLELTAAQDEVVSTQIIRTDCSLDVEINPTTGAIYYTNATPIIRLLIDSDSVIDGTDNCPDTVDPGQENDVHPGTPAGDHCEDPEPDGVFDIDDNCPDAANALHENADFDLNAEGITIYGGLVPADARGDDCDDDDNDSPSAFPNDWTDAKEALIGTDPKEACNRDPTTDNAWPPDTRSLLSASERDNEATGPYLLPLKVAFGSVDGVPSPPIYNPWVDWSGLSGFPDGSVAGFDLLPFKHAFGATCSVP